MGTTEACGSEIPSGVRVAVCRLVCGDQRTNLGKGTSLCCLHVSNLVGYCLSAVQVGHLGTRPLPPTITNSDQQTPGMQRSRYHGASPRQIASVRDHPLTARKAKVPPCLCECGEVATLICCYLFIDQSWLRVRCHHIP
jgi:hypothetical protein